MIENHHRNNLVSASPSNILDKPVPEFNVPIFESTPFAARNNVALFKSLANTISKPIIGKINKFKD